MATGRGDSLGAALVDAWGGRAARGRRSYTAAGWHAQLSALTATRAGREAADRAGLAPTARTLLRWLAHPGNDTPGAPTAANRQKIVEAYRALSSGWHASIERSTHSITGLVCVGEDCRERGKRGTSPLRIDGRNGTWWRIAGLWADGNRDPEGYEFRFIEDVILRDLELSKDIRFPGNDYTVTLP